MVEGRSDAAGGSRIRYGMVGGGQGAFIGDGHGAVAQFGSARHQLLGVRGAAQKGEVAGADQLGIFDFAHDSVRGRCWGSYRIL